MKDLAACRRPAVLPTSEISATRLVVPGLFWCRRVRTLSSTAQEGVQLGGGLRRLQSTTSTPPRRPRPSRHNEHHQQHASGATAVLGEHWSTGRCSPLAARSKNYTDYAQIPQTTAELGDVQQPRAPASTSAPADVVNWAAKAGGSAGTLRLEGLEPQRHRGRHPGLRDLRVMEVQPAANANYQRAFAFTFPIANDSTTQYCRIAGFLQNSGVGLAITSSRVWFDPAPRRGDSWPSGRCSSTWSRPEHHRGGTGLDP